jgi:hypothetical protein
VQSLPERLQYGVHPFDLAPKHSAIRRKEYGNSSRFRRK